MMTVKILNFGSLNLDYVYNVPHFAASGETVDSLSQNINPGGKGLNQSVALSRAGGDVYHAGCVGAGGESLIELLKDNGVDTSLIRQTGAIQGNAVIEVTPNGENKIIIYGGSNRMVTASQVNETISRFEKGDLLLLQNEINLLPEIIEAAFLRGLDTVLNPSPYNSEIEKVDFNKLKWLIVNETEARAICLAAEPKEVFERLHEVYPALSLVVTLGEIGSEAFFVHPGEKIEHEKVPAFNTRAVDTTGAGDTYTGYFFVSLSEGLSLKDAMETAAMASCLAVQRPGAAQSIPKREEVLKALKSIN